MREYQSHSKMEDSRVSLQLDSGHEQSEEQEEEEALSIEYDEALLIRPAMHFGCARDKIGPVAVLSEALTTEEAQRALERLQLEGKLEWKLDVAQFAEHMGVEAQEMLLVAQWSVYVCGAQ